MTCPACDRELQPMPVGAITVDVCRGGCGGIWFDNYELRKVDESREAAGEALLDIERGEDVTLDRSRARQCPKCDGQRLLTHLFGPGSEVEVDECPSCGGLWLDYGELAQIRGEYDSAEERKRATQSYFSQLFDQKLDHLRAQSEADLERVRKLGRIRSFMGRPGDISSKR